MWRGRVGTSIVLSRPRPRPARPPRAATLAVLGDVGIVPPDFILNVRWFHGCLHVLTSIDGGAGKRMQPSTALGLRLCSVLAPLRNCQRSTRYPVLSRPFGLRLALAGRGALMPFPGA